MLHSNFIIRINLYRYPTDNGIITFEDACFTTRSKYKKITLNVECGSYLYHFSVGVQMHCSWFNLHIAWAISSVT